MPAIPPTGDFNKSTIDKDTFHAKFLAVHAYLTGLLGSDGLPSTALGSLGVSSFIKTLLDDADAATARATLGAGTGNGTVTGVTGTAPVVSSGGTTPAISMPAASAGANGYMSAAYASKLDGIAAGANVGYPTDAGVNAIGMLVTAKNNSGSGAAVASGGTTSGAALLDDLVPGTLPGTWRNVGASSVADTGVGRFQRIA